jgi:hypothetical protein
MNSYFQDQPGDDIQIEENSSNDSNIKTEDDDNEMKRMKKIK